MSEDQNSSEQRQFPRITVNTAVSFAIVMPAYETGSTEDISQGGLCLKVNRVLPLGTVLRLEFDLPGDKPEHIEVLGKVVWQRPDTAAVFSTGIKFLS